MDSAGFREAAGRQPRCIVPDCPDPHGPWQAHHVVYEQVVQGKTVWIVERRDLSPWDPRNAARVCLHDHYVGQHGARKRIPLAALPDSALEFAQELLGGPRAVEYLQRTYAGWDRRLDLLRERQFAAGPTPDPVLGF